MISRFVTFLAACLALQLPVAVAQNVNEQLREFVRTDLLHNVVKITASGEEARGYGLIVGREFDRLYVATALHILPEAFVYGDPGAPPVSVRLYQLNETWEAVPGRVTGPAELDLAIIEVDVPRFPRGDGVAPLGADHWRERVLDADPRVGERAELMASVHKIGYVGGNARVSRVDGGKVIAFDDLRGTEGQSGAPVSTERGIVGIYLGIITPQIVSLPDIAEVVGREIGPGAYQLVPVDPLPSPATLCVHVRDAPQAEISITGPNGLLDLDEDGCAETLSGPHQATGAFVACEPDTFVIRPGERLRLAVACKSIPDGVWVARGQGFLEVRRCGPDCWDLMANLPQSRGELRGRLEGVLPRLSLASGLLRGRIPVGGSAVVNTDGLRLDLFAQGEFFEEEFVRP